MKKIIIIRKGFFSDGRKVEGVDVMKDKDLKLDEIDVSLTH